MKIIGVEMAEKLKLVCDYNDSDVRLQNSICFTCRIKVYKLVKDNKKFILPDYSKFTYPTEYTNTSST